VLSVSSKVALAIGITLSVAAISAIFVAVVSAQNLTGSIGSGGGSQSTSQQQQQSSQPQNAASSGTGANNTSATSTITIPVGAVNQNVQHYEPNPATVAPNSRVTWDNQDSVEHTATSGTSPTDPDAGKLFDTGLIQPGGSGSATVPAQGTIPYHCTIHPWMTATLQVSSSSSAGGGSLSSSQQNETGAQQSQQQQGGGNQTAGNQTAQTGSSNTSFTPTQQQSSNSPGVTAVGTTTQQQQPAQSSGSTPATTTAATTGTTSLATTQVKIPIQAAEKPSGQGNYNPEDAQVPSGATVTWVNQDTVAHTATARDGSFNTGNINGGASGTANVQGQGNVDYYCTIHPWMIASLTIGGPSTVATSSSVSGAGATTATTSSNNTGQQQQPQQLAAQNNATTTATSTTAGGGGGGFTVQLHPSTFEILPKSNDTDLGTEPEHKDDWITANHDHLGTRNSLQTTIGKNNVSQLQVKWILNNDRSIENPPLIIGDRGYAQDNAMKVIAFDANTGLNLWQYDPGLSPSELAARGAFSHGMTYDQGVIFAPTGLNGTVVALNATNGELIWESASIGPNQLGYELPMPPLIWNDYVVVGAALGDDPPFNPPAKGTVHAFNRTNGETIWNISTVTGAWVEGTNGTQNGGASVWSGGSIDPQTGIIYLPTGNPAPDFDVSTRPQPNEYANSVIAVDIRNGNILWATNTVPTTDEHDWDTTWGTSLANMTMEDGSTRPVVLAQNKKGDALALDSADGRVIWNDTLGVQFRTFAGPQPYGSGAVWPGTQYGIESYNANDGETVYYAVSNMGFNFFTTPDQSDDYVVPLFDAIENGVGNGTVTAVDIKTGQIKWEHPTEFPTWVSPSLTNDIVFSGHITATGKPYAYNDFGAPTDTPLIPAGIIMALDKETGEKLWEFNVGAPIGIGGPSIGNGMLFVTTGSPAEIPANMGGYIVAFGLPESGNETTTNSTTAMQQQQQQQTSEASGNNTTTTAAAGSTITPSNTTAAAQQSNNSRSSNITTNTQNNNSSVRTSAGQ
jgi:alcohol dehydrogenase (cytochrome c)